MIVGMAVLPILSLELPCYIYDPFQAKDLANTVNLRKEEDISISDVYISIKTTVGNHATRVQLLLDTWFPLARGQVWFYSDRMDQSLDNKTSMYACVRTSAQWPYCI